VPRVREGAHTCARARAARCTRRSHTDIISRACSQGHGDLNYLPPHLSAQPPPSLLPLPVPRPTPAPRRPPHPFHPPHPVVAASNAAFEGNGGRGQGNGHVPLGDDVTWCALRRDAPTAPVLAHRSLAIPRSMCRQARRDRQTRPRLELHANPPCGENLVRVPIGSPAFFKGRGIIR
jgi:hypothetical protein